MTSQPEQQAADTVTVSRVEWAPVPRVNLLPQEILDARGFRKVRVRLGLVLLVAILLGGVGTVWSQAQVGNAQAGLDEAAARTVLLHRKEARYAEVPKLTGAVDAAKAARQQVLGQDVLWYRLLNDVALATPSSVWLNTVNVTLTSTSGTSTQAASSKGSTSSADVLTPTGIGTLSVTGAASTYPDVSAWLESIAQVKGLEASTLQNITRQTTATGTSGPLLQFTSQVVVSDAALSHRYDRKAR